MSVFVNYSPYMADTERQRGNPAGRTAEMVAKNVRAVRIDRDLTQADLSERLSAVGRPIPVASIGKLETGLRKIEVDDLMALAVALNVSPLRLLLPDTRGADDKVNATAIDVTTASDIWEWAAGITPLGIVDGGNVWPRELSVEERERTQSFQSRSRPWWFRISVQIPLLALSEEHQRDIVGRAESSDG